MLIIRRDIKKLLAVSMFVLASGTVAAQNRNAGDTIKLDIARANKGVPVNGVIKDAVTHKGLSGIRVQVEDFSASITDSTGRFTLNVPSYTSTVLIESEGYDTRRVPLRGLNTIDVELLDEAHESIHENVTMPFGPVSKTAVTAAVGQYTVGSAWTQPSELTDAVLQGRIAGLNAIRRSGTPGVGANLVLRGYNSLYATNKPLIVVDNMIYDANEYGESIIANNYTNPLALIDIKDIDNITVLKDASSIYGTKGANGAIIVTTARAKTQATKIDFALYTGFNTAPSTLPVMEAADYRVYLSEMLQSKGLTPAQIQAQPYMNDDPNQANYARYHYNTNWQKKVLQNSLNQNYFLKVTGGDNIATYGLSMGFTRDEGTIKSTDITRYNTRFNAEFNFSKQFTGVANLSFSYNEQNLKDQGMSDKTAPLFLSLVKAPFLSDKEVNNEGVESPNLADRDTLGISNPSSIIDNMLAYNKYYRFMGTFGFNYQVSKYVKASTLFGIVYDKVRENFFVPRKGVAEDTLSNAIAESRMGTQVKRLFTLYNDTRLEYNRTYSRIHKVGARIGMRYQANKSEQDFSLGFNSATDDLVSVQNGLNALRLVGGGIGDWNWLNAYVGSDYGYRDKLFVSLNAAMDGSSRFGKQAVNGINIGGNKFAVMPSVGLAWLISSENFMAHSPFDLLKLRATYSITGNDDIGNYSARQTYTAQNLLGAQGLVRKGIANPALQWETGKKLNVGLDLAFWNERVSLSLDAYKNVTDNMLVYQPLNTTAGFTSILTNQGKMQNTGLEASLNIRAVNTRDFKWDAGINAATNRNKMLAIPGNQLTTEYAGGTILTRVGDPANQFYGYQTNGVFATDADAAGLTKKNPDGSFVAFRGGDVRFTDVDGNKIIDENDRVVIGNPMPDFTGGFSNRIMYRRFELNALFTFSQGNDVYNYVRYRLESVNGIENQLVSVANRWRGSGQVTNTPRASWGDPMGNSRFSDRWIEDGSYIRLRSLSLQYSVPMKAAGFLKSTTVYATANNLFTLTKYKGFDPEFSATQSIFSQGIDTGLDPLYRTITLGIRLGL
ncbi:SusC/RagA family TonB-linked outer membrane protein [Segetibacter sp. 3557_3]|uniref:SusC/RagA family TonB-linked outer membrane protein n=1 Tax=Segetibacter sp. 3557_3 TaxID=2547429 RepID=UPI00105852EC|nr:SusC/RagA family TonB-linked outer membrane protein [Segetibacter sp. 3557_3]TDH26584.1 SusC/RagA family TonB-linked outer membrane protein [Segetibacter sp. 3557_3]